MASQFHAQLSRPKFYVRLCPPDFQAYVYISGTKTIAHFEKKEGYFSATLEEVEELVDTLDRIAEEPASKKKKCAVIAESFRIDKLLISRSDVEHLQLKLPYILDVMKKFDTHISIMERIITDLTEELALVFYDHSFLNSFESALTFWYFYNSEKFIKQWLSKLEKIELQLNRTKIITSAIWQTEILKSKFEDCISQKQVSPATSPVQRETFSQMVDENTSSEL